MNLAFFEDDLYENFLPLTCTRPVYDLRCGIDELHKKICRMFPGAKRVYFTREYLAPTFKKKFGAPVNEVGALDDDTVFVNGCLLPEEGPILNERFNSTTALLHPYLTRLDSTGLPETPR